jgi:3-oxoacyl-[acyl-carrier protein] reductase
MRMSGRLEGRVALVTGASRGIGRATAVVFAREGAAVVVNYATRGQEAEAVVDDIRRDGGQAAHLQADVADPSAVSALVGQTVDRFGRIDVLINNAGIHRPGSALTVSDDVLDGLFAVNVKGILHCVQAAAPKMVERGYGRIVNIASVAGLVTNVADNTPYAASKAAVLALTKRLALELGPHGITANAICPGFIRTGMALRGNPEERLAAFAAKAVVGRVGEPEDIAHSALFLAGAEAGFITGQILTVDGGRTDFFSHSA